MDLTGQTQIDVHKLKDVARIVQGSMTVEPQFIWPAWWIKERYGSVMNQALKMVLSIKQKIRETSKRKIRILMGKGVFKESAEEAGRRKHKARLWLSGALFRTNTVPHEEVVNRLSSMSSAIKPLLEAGVVAMEVMEEYRDPPEEMKLLTGSQKRKQDVSDEQESGLRDTPSELNPFQREIADVVIGEYGQGIRRIYLLHGVTRSGKTEVCMGLTAYVLSAGRQVIVLTPEISLTWQTVVRFYSCFGDRVPVMNSCMPAGERYDQYRWARIEDIDIAIGLCSAFLAPFGNLGLIIIDEEHEDAYKNELFLRYDARGAATKRAQTNDASLILGSATPFLESYTRALRGEYGLPTLKEGVKEGACLPRAEIMDLQEGLKEGNRSIFSRRLKTLIKERLEKREQATLFISRKGYANFVSYRSCGETAGCPHCDTTPTLYQNGRMTCHYCGYSVPQPKKCPVCSSPYVAPFGIGIQKIEAMAAELFPKARILRMDLDITSRKGRHQGILSSFTRREADIFIGIQMTVKGHDSSKVTPVRALAIDLSLYTSDCRCAEQTSALLTRMTGRVGRGQLAGKMMIQTYQSDHYSIRMAVSQDYVSFHRRETAYRKLLGHPPAVTPLTVRMVYPAEGTPARIADLAVRWVQRQADCMEQEKVQGYKSFRLIGPANAAIYKVNDIYRKILHIKHENCDILIQIRKATEGGLKGLEGRNGLTVQYNLT